MRESSRKNLLEKELLLSKLRRPPGSGGLVSSGTFINTPCPMCTRRECHSTFKGGEQRTSRAVQRLQASAAGARNPSRVGEQEKHNPKQTDTVKHSAKVKEDWDGRTQEAQETVVSAFCSEDVGKQQWVFVPNPSPVP